MVKVIVVLGIISFFAFMPVYMFEQTVLPQLVSLKQTYGNVDALASQSAGTP